MTTKTANGAANKKGSARKQSVKKQTIKDLIPIDADSKNVKGGHDIRGGPNHFLTGRC